MLHQSDQPVQKPKVYPGASCSLWKRSNNNKGLFERITLNSFTIIMQPAEILAWLGPPCRESTSSEIQWLDWAYRIHIKKQMRDLQKDYVNLRIQTVWPAMLSDNGLRLILYWGWWCEYSCSLQYLNDAQFRSILGVAAVWCRGRLGNNSLAKSRNVIFKIPCQNSVFSVHPLSY